MMKEKRPLNKNRIKLIAGILLLLAAFLLYMAARFFQGFSQWYSTHIYTALVGTIGWLSGCFPFSISEVLLYVLLLCLLISAVRFFIQKVRNTACRQEVYAWLSDVFFLVGILFFLYVINCGVNYYRDSFSESSGIVAEEYSVEELKEVCLWLTEQVNDAGEHVTRDSDGVMVLDISVRENAVNAMQKLGEEYPELAGYYPQPKGLINSWILSIQSLTGIYSPFTIEANYNQAMADYNIPFTACHELSHLRGFMQEQEANFIAFLASSKSEEEVFRYSGYLLGWIQCMNVLYKVDYNSWEEVRSQLSDKVEPDLSANREFWAKYDGAVAEVSNKVNDTYLKANGQEDGVKSYNRMVDLIVAYYIAK